MQQNRLKKSRLLKIFATLLLVPAAFLCVSWGFWAHKHINWWAIQTLPEPLQSFYKLHGDSIRERAVAPDLRRRTDKSEGMRHYLDADHYGVSPFDSIPQSWDAAVKKYSADTLYKYGIVPWQITNVLKRLTQAFKDGNTDSIVFLSADLGHYVADAHVPLHTTKNYDGQLTGQKGIHALWEARIVEMDSMSYNFKPTKARYLKDPQAEAWQILRDSYTCLDSVLTLDQQVKKEIPQDQWYTNANVDGRDQKTFSTQYAAAYNKKLNGMIARRMQASVEDVGSYWYTAWVDAGKPDLAKKKK
ncbi:MAG TPA: zinc dependent phospholipase C family protein [Bacteroidia bacterium]|nr:zinc dependent phospholipase C family protein [Bacteroidia bacterium]